jgi:Domain of unknown function (DUF4265)
LNFLEERHSEVSLTKAALVKVVFPLDPSEWHGSASESIWAEATIDGAFRILNSPSFVFGVSLDDVVAGSVSDDLVEFAGVVSRAGHSTYRIFPGNVHGITSSKFRWCWEPLGAAGCSFEEGFVLSVDVPPSANIHSVYQLLSDGVARGVWEFEEAHCGHTL